MVGIQVTGGKPPPKKEKEKPSISVNVVGPTRFDNPSTEVPQRAPESETTTAQKLEGRQFIQNRERLVNAFKSLGHTDTASRRLANQQIARELDIEAGAKPDIFGNTNQSSRQVSAGEFGQARERAKAEFPITETPQEPGFTELAKGFIQNPTQQQSEKSAGAIIRPMGQLFFAALDVFRQGASRVSGIGSKKPLTLNQATETYNELVGSLRSDISDMGVGLQDPAVVRDKIVQAQNAIGRYESYLKNYNLLNIGHYVDGGAEEQAQLITMRDNLNDIRNDFEVAKQQLLVSQFVQQRNI